MNKHNNLVWIVAGMSIMLSLVVLCDSSAFGAYRQQNPGMPGPALAVQALAEGNVFLPRQEAEPVKAAAALTAVKTVKTEVNVPVKTAPVKSVRVAEGEPAAEIGPGVPGPGTEAPAEVPAENAQPAPAGTPAMVTADISYFNDACFIGDSFTQGLSIYSKNPGADYYYYVGVSTKGMNKPDFVLPGGGKGRLMDALAQKQYKKIYILLGINELGSDAPEVFAQRYGELIAQIRAIQPDATVFIQSILHTTADKSANSVFKNETINSYNAALKTLADGQRIFYIDINPLFDDETGALRGDISGDGVHLKAPCYIEWRDYLLRNVPAGLVTVA